MAVISNLKLGGSSSINYIVSSDAENGLGKWTAYNDGADANTNAVLLKDGVGGVTGGVTITTSSINPIRDKSSYVLSKDGLNRQGQGVSIDFVIDTADKAKVLTLSFDYVVTSASGSYLTGALQVWLYDVDNSILIQPAGYQIQSLGNGLPGKHISTFQTSSNSSNYRLILHVASTSTTSYTLALDNIVVGPQTVQYGAPVTDWQAYTPTFSASFGTCTNISLYSRRVGDTLQVQGSFNAGTVTASTATMTLGYQGGNGNVTIDPTKNKTGVAGVAIYQFSGTTNFSGYILNPGTASNLVQFGLQTSSASGQTAASSATIVLSGQLVQVQFEVPIQGWSSTVQMSNDTDTRVVAARYYATASLGTLTGATTAIYPVKDIDTHSAYNTTTGVYTVPVAGVYRLFCQFRCDSPTTASYARIYKNGSLYTEGGLFGAATYASPTTTAIVQCNAGDTLNFAGNSGSVSVVANNTFNYMSIERLSGPSAIATSESISASYSTSAGNSLTAATPTLVVFGTREFDSHGIYSTSTGLVTIPVSGKWRVSLLLTNSGTSLTTSQTFEAQVFKNGSFIRHLGATFGNGASTTYRVVGSTTLNLLAGDTISFYGQTPNASTLFTNAQYNYFCIERTGN
jgi:hypothetical protein